MILKNITGVEIFFAESAYTVKPVQIYLDDRCTNVKGFRYTVIISVRRLRLVG